MIANSKLKTLAQIEGISVEDILARATSDSVVTGICISKDCDGIARVEPDCTNGYCELCNRQTIQSPLILAEIL